MHTLVYTKEGPKEPSHEEKKDPNLCQQDEKLWRAADESLIFRESEQLFDTDCEYDYREKELGDQDTVVLQLRHDVNILAWSVLLYRVHKQTEKED